MLHVVEERGAHVEDQAFADPRRVVALHECEAGVEERQEDGAERQQPDELAVLVGDRGVDQRAQDQRRYRADHRGEHDADDEPDQLRAVRAREVQDPAQEVAFEPLALDRLGVAAESVDRRVHHRRVLSVAKLPAAAGPDGRNVRSLTSGG